MGHGAQRADHLRCILLRMLSSFGSTRCLIVMVRGLNVWSAPDIIIRRHWRSIHPSAKTNTDVISLRDMTRTRDGSCRNSGDLYDSFVWSLSYILPRPHDDRVWMTSHGRFSYRSQEDQVWIPSYGGLDLFHIEVRRTKYGFLRMED